MTVLDTHMWIWFHVGDRRLPERVAVAISDEREGIGLSVVSLWETMQLIERSRVSSALTPELTVRRWSTERPMTLLPIDTEVAILSRSLPFAHNDPADRLIAATVVRHGAALATVDDRLLSLNWLPTIPV